MVSVIVCAIAALLVAPGTASAATRVALDGTFRLTAGSCAGGHINGTYLRMILPSGTAAGPYMSNSDSSCSDQSYTPLRPGSDGGLISGGYQATPSPAFDAKGNAQAGRITAPAQFYGTAFATSSNPVDPQTKTAVARPQIYASGNRLSGDLRAFSVTWNSQYFNQGSPKPNGNYPGATSAVAGSYDRGTGAFTLTWTSQVVGGPFDKFTGLWHLTGTFVPAHGGSPSHAGGAGGGANGSTSHPATSAATGSQPSLATPTVRTPASGSGSASAAAAVPGGSPSGSGTSIASGARLAAATSTVTKTRWHVEWWVIAIALLVAVAGFVALGLLGRGGGTGTRRAA